MRILLVNPAYDEGLAPEALLDRYDTLTSWGEALRATGGIEVVTLQRFSRDLELERAGIRYLLRADPAGPRPKPWTRPRRFLRAAHGSGADLVHANGLAFPLLLWQLRKTLPASTPLLVQHHGGRPRHLAGFQAPFRRALWQLGLSGADAFLFTAAEQAAPWRAAGLIQPEQTVHAVPESSRFIPRVAREGARLRSGLQGRPQLLWVGHLVPSKDPLGVIDGFSRALPALPGAELAFVYRKDDLLPALRERLSRDSTLSAHVRLLGPRTQELLPDVYGSSDVFVSGSHEEGSGYALLEALSCGLVPVVTDIPSFRALTAGGSLGRLWPTGDSGAFSQALLDVACRPLEPQRDAVIRHFEAELSWPAVARRALAVYRRSIAARRS